jgi:hypothetical protein
MGLPGTGLAGRDGMPGRGAEGAPGIIAGRVSFATRSGLGGTTGLWAGWPAKFGLAGGRSGMPPPTLVCPAFPKPA